MNAPYFADEMVSLYLGDFREILPQLGPVDLIVADPPYGETSLDWDHWVSEWPGLLSRHASSMWCFGSMRMYLEHSAEFLSWWKFSQDIVWEKHNGSSLAADRFRRVHELPTFWYQGAWADIYADVPTTPDATPRSVRRKALPPQHQGARGPSVYRSEDGGPRIMRSVIYARSMHGSAINETEKPVGLLEPMISFGCPPGGVLLDPFAGSCSTAVAARAIGRHTICIEKRESQCEKAAKRLAQAPLDFASAGVL